MRTSSTAAVAASPARPVIFCDFDGTITQTDVTDQILTELAHPSWREIEQEWVRGQIGSRECLERQMALVEASPQELRALIDSIPIDPHFAAFCRFGRAHGIPFYVLSDGFDYVIQRVLRRSGVRGALRNGSHLFASGLRVQGRRLIPAFPCSAEPCEHGCATCKAALIRRLGAGRTPIIFIGDGLSDRFAVAESDWVFAKRQLLAACREQGIACQPFETFAEIQRALEEWLSTGQTDQRLRKARKPKGRSRKSGGRSRSSEVLVLSREP
jgi:2-hydroxy-3-keto-5-methylthiopentenyl-1-phosphate phosphatase